MDTACLRTGSEPLPSHSESELRSRGGARLWRPLPAALAPSVTPSEGRPWRRRPLTWHAIVRWHHSHGPGKPAAACKLIGSRVFVRSESECEKCSHPGRAAAELSCQFVLPQFVCRSCSGAEMLQNGSCVTSYFTLALICIAIIILLRPVWSFTYSAQMK